ncbi:MAG: D-2-hydroxyacid dehydrogenase [Flavobacteriales bacterium]|nr:D-2-hydroxyacid dehydrogenase [Flavobacteriales bacterium]
MNIVILDASTLGKVNNLQLLEKYGSVTSFGITSQAQVFERSKKADIILTNKVILNKTQLEKLPNLKLICITATGMNNVDLAYAEEKGISVKNVIGYSTHSVSQVTFSMVLRLLSNLCKYDAYVKSKDYVFSPIFTHLANGFDEIHGKKWGIIGMGNIGRNVAKIATAFGAEISYHSTSGVSREEGFSSVSMDELLRESDIISVHSPLNDKTTNLIGENEFAKMKSNAVLINVARGGIVNEEDLVSALNNNVIAGAGVDVFTNEPIEKQSPFFNVLNQDKIVLSPHIAWASTEARHQLIEKVINNIEEFLDDKN